MLRLGLYTVLFGKKVQELGIQNETFNSPPSIVSATLSYRMTVRSDHDQMAETFNSPPAITSTTLSQISI